MADDRATTPTREGIEPGIRWEPGEEDYPFPALPGESALDFVRRWLDSAGYARIEQDGVRFVHEVDVLNLVNNVTADIDLLRARLGEFGDQIVAASDHAATVRRIETAIDELNAALLTLNTPLGR
jgi:hypothetical protein